MRFRYETGRAKEARQQEWHDHFCLWPVAHNGTVYWLETIQRKSIGTELGAWMKYVPIWTYRAAPE